MGPRHTRYNNYGNDIPPQEDETNQSSSKSTLNIQWKNWCWSWSSNALATWCEEPTRWKRPWCWERAKAKGEEGDRGWNGEIAWLLNGHEFNKLWEIVKDREGWCVAIHGVSKSWTQLSDWTTVFHCIYVPHLYPFICWWALRLLPYLGYCK